MYDRYVVIEMLQVVKNINPEYPTDIEQDGRAAMKIAEFICRQLNANNGPDNNAYTVIPVWEQLYTVIHQDPFYGQKSLNTISNHIPEFWQKTAYGDRKTTKLSADKLRKKIASKYFERKQNNDGNASGPL